MSPYPSAATVRTPSWHRKKMPPDNHCPDRRASHAQRGKSDPTCLPQSVGVTSSNPAHLVSLWNPLRHKASTPAVRLVSSSVQTGSNTTKSDPRGANFSTGASLTPIFQAQRSPSYHDPNARFRLALGRLPFIGPKTATTYNIELV